MSVSKTARNHYCLVLSSIRQGRCSKSWGRVLKDGKLWRGKAKSRNHVLETVTTIVGWDVQSGRRLHLIEKWLIGNCLLLREQEEGKGQYIR